MTLTRAWLLNLATVIGDDPATRDTIRELLTEPEFKDAEAHIQELTLKHLRPAFASMLAEYSRRLTAARQARIKQEEPPQEPKPRHKHRPKAISNGGGYVN